MATKISQEKLKELVTEFLQTTLTILFGPADAKRYTIGIGFLPKTPNKGYVFITLNQLPDRTRFRKIDLDTTLSLMSAINQLIVEIGRQYGYQLELDICEPESKQPSQERTDGQTQPRTRSTQELDS